MNHNKPESRKVRKFIQWMILPIALVAVSLGIFLYLNDEEIVLNQASKQLKIEKDSLRDVIETRTTEIDLWLTQIEKYHPDAEVEHRDEVESMKRIKKDLQKEKASLSDDEINLKHIKSGVKALVEEYESNSEAITLNTSVDV